MGDRTRSDDNGADDISADDISADDISAADAAAFVLSLEKRALGSNYGFPRDIVMFPERKKLIRTGKNLFGNYPSVEAYNGDPSLYFSGMDLGSSSVNLHFGLTRSPKNGRHYCWKLHDDRPELIVWHNERDKECIELIEEDQDDDTVYETGSESYTAFDTVRRRVNFGRVLREAPSYQWDDDRIKYYAYDRVEKFSDFVVHVRNVGLRGKTISMLMSRSLDEYFYDIVDTFGHCAIGMTQFDGGVYNVYWHVGVKRYYIGQYVTSGREVTQVTMLSWRVCIIQTDNRASDEFCYIGEN